MTQHRYETHLPGAVERAVRLCRPRSERVTAAGAGVDQIVRRQRIRVVALQLTGIARGVIAVPGVSETGAEAPSALRLACRRDLPGQVFAVRSPNVAHDVPRRLTEIVGAQIVRGAGWTIVVGSLPSVGPSVGDRYRNGECVERLVEVLPREGGALEAPHAAGPQGDAAGQRAFEPGAGLVEHRECEVWIEGFDRGATAPALKRPLLAGFPDAALVGIRPFVLTRPLRGVGIGVESDGGVRSDPVPSKGEFRQRPAIAGHVDDRRQARRERIPVGETGDGSERLPA